ncbi:helix-turn-helix domain-containing protein [Micromonospora sp. NPDC049114]|uniref:GlxA family transcriptional regulator n=1 Tax=Micromonospora sp. NPDC049114 TaxID=3155498 RepID=UPI0033C2BAE7
MVERVTVVAFGGVQSLDVAGPWEVLTGANRYRTAHGDERAYDLRLVGTEAEVASESGLVMVAGALGEPVSGGTLVVPGGRTAAAGDEHDDLVAWLRGCRPTRLVSICSGAFLCARAGLLSGRRVATHWSLSRELARRFSDLTVDHDALYVHDGPVWTSGGVTSGIDLALAVVAADHGARVAQEIARWLVMFLHRPGQQAQFSGPVWLERATDRRVAAVQRAIDADPAATHRVDDLAAQLAMSPRHFQRLFARETGLTVGRYRTELRLETAKRLLVQSDLALDVVAVRAGFGSAESLRRVFGERLGTTPGAFRARFSTL